MKIGGKGRREEGKLEGKERRSGVLKWLGKCESHCNFQEASSDEKFYEHLFIYIRIFLAFCIILSLIAVQLG